MKLSVRCVQVCILLQSIWAFSPSNVPVHSAMKNQHNSRRLMAAQDDDDVSIRNSLCAFGLGAMFFAASIACPPPAIATSPVEQSQDYIFSSSIQISETVKTMDFSLPSSYDSISDAKASATEELVQEENIITGTEVKKAPKKKASSSNEGFNLGGQPLSPEEKQALAAQRQAEREAKEAAEAEKQAEREAIAAAKKAEKEAERQAAAAAKEEENARAQLEKEKKIQANKEAKAKAAKEAEAKATEKTKKANLAGAEFVDMGLPSYGDATAAKEKSAYSL